MDDLRQRFAMLDRVAVPELWNDVERRTEALWADVPTRPLAGVRPSWRRVRESEGSPREASMPRSRRRLLLLLAALVTIALVGGVIAVGSGFVRLSSVIPPPTALRSPVTDTTTPSPVEASPSPAPAVPLGGRDILVQSFKGIAVDGPHDVFALDAGTGEQTLLGSLPGPTKPIFSGQHPYAFQRSADGQRVLILDSFGAPHGLESPTAASRAFTFVDASTINDTNDLPESIVLSPRGDRIAAINVDRFDTPTDVEIIDVPGGGRTRLPLPSGKNGFGLLSWAPDESALISSGCRPCNKANSPTEKQTPYHDHILVIPVDGSPWREMLDVDNGGFSGAWSPDGKTLAIGTSICPSGSFMPRCDPEQSRSTLGSLTLPGNEAKTFFEVPGLLYVTWSPDGRRIAYRADDGIYIVNADGTDPRRVSTGDAIGLAWSPDSQWLLFERFERETSPLQLLSPNDLWIVSATGDGLREIGTEYAGAAW